MKRTILCFLSSLILAGLCWADSNDAVPIPVKHHASRHHAHKAGKHHVPKRHHRTV